MSRLERALADLVGGHAGGWSMWSAALATIARTVEDMRDDGQARFLSHPPGELNKLLVALEDALRMASLAVELQLVLRGEGDQVGDDDRRRQTISELLLDRARQLVDDAG